MNHRFIVISSLLCGFIWLGIHAVQDVSAHGADTGAVEGSGQRRSDIRTLPAFTAIELRDASDLELTIGPDTRVVVEADDNLLEQIRTDVDGNTLIISSEGRYHARRTPTLRVTVPTLEALTVHGSGTARLHALDAGPLRLAIHGSGDIAAEGRADALTILVNGSGDAALSALVAQHVDAAINGSGDIAVDARKSLAARINGSGDIRYQGQPAQLSKQVHGSGEIAAR